MKVKQGLFLIVVIGLLLVGCSKEVPVTEEMYDHLEESVTLETDYLKYQQQINELEIQDQELYDEIVDLSMDDFDEIQRLANDALENVEERQEKIELEKDSIQASKDEFLKIESLLTEIEEDDVKKSAEEMHEQMIKRYDLYDELYSAYTASLTFEQKLYELMLEEEATHEKTTEHIEDINESYEEVLKINESFNEATVEYNKLKKEFYSSADMNIKYDDDED